MLRKAGLERSVFEGLDVAEGINPLIPHFSPVANREEKKKGTTYRSTAHSSAFRKARKQGIRVVLHTSVEEILSD